MLQVIWDPHRHLRDDRPFLEIAFFSGCLKCMDVVEPYHPERVLRQFGRIQTIPRAPLAPARASRGPTAGSYRIAYDFLDQIWEQWEDHVLSRGRRSHPVVRPSDCVPGYMAWYSRITHLVVHPPESRSSIYHHARPEDVDFEEVRRRSADAISIGTSTLHLGRMEIASLGTDYMYDVMSHMVDVLQGQHISTVEPDVPGPSRAPSDVPGSSRAPPQQYRQRRRRNGD